MPYSFKWHGIFYMPSRIDTAAHTKAFDYPVMGHSIVTPLQYHNIIYW